MLPTASGGGSTRAIWSGTITFGLITVPVKLYTAVDRRKEMDFHMLHEKDAEGSTIELSDMTKDELYEKAKELNIRGRSAMDKRELISAIDQGAGSAAA